MRAADGVLRQVSRSMGNDVGQSERVGQMRTGSGHFRDKQLENADLYLCYNWGAFTNG